MKYLTQAEYDELVDAKKQLATFNELFEESEILAVAHELVAEAARRGQVLTIEQRPLTPLAMGHYETVVAIRKARHQP